MSQKVGSQESGILCGERVGGERRDMRCIRDTSSARKYSRSLKEQDDVGTASKLNKSQCSERRQVFTASTAE